MNLCTVLSQIVMHLWASNLCISKKQSIWGLQYITEPNTICEKINLSEFLIRSVKARYQSLKKHYKEFTKKWRGWSLFIRPKRPFLAQKWDKTISFMKVTQFWVDCWYHVSRGASGTPIAPPPKPTINTYFHKVIDVPYYIFDVNGKKIIDFLHFGAFKNMSYFYEKITCFSLFWWK